MATYELTPEQQNAKAERLLATLQMMSESQLKNYWDNCEFKCDPKFADDETVSPIGADKVEMTPAAIVRFIRDESGVTGPSDRETCGWDDYFIPLAERILSLQSLLEAMTPEQLRSFYDFARTCPHTQIVGYKAKLQRKMSALNSPMPDQIMDILATKAGLCGQDDWDCYIEGANYLLGGTVGNN